VPVEEYLRPQKRFAHLFARRASPDVLARIQAEADRNIRRFGCSTTDATAGLTMDKPFAITLDPGSSLANKTGTWRTSARSTSTACRPATHQCPAGEDIQGWLYHAESGDYEAAWRHLTRDNPFPAIMGRVCYHSCEGACNRGHLDAAVGINSVERFLGDEALKRGWRFDARRRKPASTCWWSAPGPRACRRPTTCAAWATRHGEGSRPAAPAA
jgi:hypothetical protein